MEHDLHTSPTVASSDGGTEPVTRDSLTEEIVTANALVIDPSADVLNELVAAISEHIDTNEDTDPTPDSKNSSSTGEPSFNVQVLIEESVHRTITSEYTTASRLAELTESNSLSLRTSTDPLGGTVVLTDDRVVSLIPIDGLLGAAPIEDKQFTETAWTHYTDLWEKAETVTLRTPAPSRVRNGLEKQFGSGMWATFDELRGVIADREQGPDKSQKENQGRGQSQDTLGGVELALLAAATNEELLYEISKFGEEVGIGSRATFSRKKSQLEEVGILTTEKVPIDVGRPRLRLLLEEGVRELNGDPTALVARTESALSRV